MTVEKYKSLLSGASAVELTRACLDKIALNKALNNYITVTDEYALSCARRADKMIKSGKVTPITGVPIAVKDNIFVKGVKNTCASRMMHSFVPDFDAEAVNRLNKAGAVIVGKTNMDELAFGSTNEFSAYGAVKNALDRSRVPGGSSGGSANTVCADEVPLSLGSDTGGSVRQPAAFCGVVGLKPTFPSIDRKGLFRLSPSLEQIGLFADNCDDALAFFRVIADDIGSLPAVLDGDMRGKRVGIAKQFMSASMAYGVVRQTERAIKKIESLGAEIAEVDIPSFFAGLAAYHVISSAESVIFLNGFAKDHGLCPDDTGAEVKRRLVLGAYVTDGKNYDDIYLRAVKVRAEIRREYDAALSCCDALISPTSPDVATRLGSRTEPDAIHGNDVFLAPVSLAGLPAVSVPFGSSDGMPVGVQIIGKRRGEGEILNIGKALMSGE